MTDFHRGVADLLSGLGAPFVVSGWHAAYAVLLAVIGLIPLSVQFKSIAREIGSPLPDASPRFGREHMTRLLSAFRANTGVGPPADLRQLYIRALWWDVAFAGIYTPLLAIAAATAVSRLMPSREELVGAAVLLAAGLLIADLVENLTLIRVVTKEGGDPLGDSWWRRTRRVSTWLKFYLLSMLVAIIVVGMLWTHTTPAS